uniref:C2 domain-containing protein n=1 Tax=Romanomermis culicivorax TaxID=13658 RepID=A0A915J344_ROMCU
MSSHQEAKPDMAAVYILIGSLCVSGSVILLIIVYCTVHCWRKKCRNSNSTNTSNSRAAMTTTPLPPTTSLMTSAAAERQPFRHHRKQTPHIRVWNVNNLLPLNVSPKSMDRLMIESDDEKKSMLHYDLQYCDRNGIGSLCGLLTFALRYDHIHRVLMVHLIRASGLVHESRGRCSGDKKRRFNQTQKCAKIADSMIHDPPFSQILPQKIWRKHGKDRDTLSTYVKLHLLPDRRFNHKTNIRKNSDHPEFNEMFSFDVPYNCLSSRMLQFCREDNRQLKGIILKRFNITNFLQPRVVDFFPNCRVYQKYQKVDSDGHWPPASVDPDVKRGVFDLYHRFTVYNFERLKRHDIVGNVIMRDLFEKSDLHSWTEYTMQIIADTRQVTRTKKNFHLRKKTTTAIYYSTHPYVKMIQVCNNKRVKVKKSTRKMANLHPVYNETFVFELDNVALQSTNFLIKVMDWDRSQLSVSYQLTPMLRNSKLSHKDHFLRVVGSDHGIRNFSNAHMDLDEIYRLMCDSTYYGGKTTLTGFLECKSFHHYWGWSRVGNVLVLATSPKNRRYD